MITFIIHVRVQPANRPAFEALMAHVRDLSRANEPGVVHYDFGISAEQGDVYAIVEVYRDAAAHAAHMQTDWVRESIPESRRLVEGGFDIRQYVSPGTEPAVRQMQEPVPRSSQSIEDASASSRSHRVPVLGFNHLNIRTPDFEATTRFLSEVLGMAVMPVPGQPSRDKSAWLLDAGGHALLHLASADVRYAEGEILPDPAPRGSGAIHHVALTCTDIAAMRARLTARDIPFRENVPEDGVRQIFVTDPSDIRFELNFREG